MNLRKLWEDRIKSETSEEIVYGRFIGKLITDSTKKEEIEEYIGKIIHDLVNDLEIKEGMLILDAGVGPLARFSIEFAKKSARVIAVDISKASLNSAKKRLEFENVHFLQADIMNLPFKTGVFDISFCVATLYHMPNKGGVKKGIKEMHRVIKDRGLIFFDLENYLNPMNWQLLIPIKIFHALGKINPPHQFYKYLSLVNTLRDLNLGSIKIKTCFGLQTPLFLVKPFSAIAPQIIRAWEPIDKWLSKKADRSIILRIIGTYWYLKIKK